MADTAKDIQLRELRDTISELNKTLAELQELLKASNEREAEQKQELAILKEQNDYLMKKLYGKSSEKRSDTPGQLSFFNEAEDVQDTALVSEEEEAVEEAPEEKKRKPRSSFLSRFKGVPVTKEYLDVPEEERVCSICGTPLEKIGEEFVRRELDFHPAKVRIIEYYSINYKCPACTAQDIPTIVKGKDGKAHMLHGMASAGTVAWVMYQKYCNDLPLYRQEQDFKRNGAGLDRATLANWVITNTLDFFKPVYEYLHRLLLKRIFLMADETPVQVLKEPDKTPQSTSYMWVFRSGEDGGPPLILYKYSPTRAGDTAVNFLEGYSGYLMCDGYSGYNKVTTAKRTSCWSHVRRYLLDAVPKGKQYDYSQPAVQGVLYVQKLFSIEKDIKRTCRNFDEIKEARNSKEREVLDGFWSWLDRQHPAKNSRLYKAVVYIRNRKQYLETYLEDGRCSFSNNWTENSVRPVTVGRKNWLFCDTQNGANASAIVYSLVELAKSNGVNIYQYLTYLLEKLPLTPKTDEEIEKLMPWHDDVKEEIDRRVVAAM